MKINDRDSVRFTPGKGIQMYKHCNSTGKEVPEKWLDEMHETVDVTYQLLDELAVLGHKYKTITQINLIEIDCPVWRGLSETEGLIEINPFQHDPRAIAHELGHGFEERWRRPQDRQGEMMAEAVRYFVEERMGKSDWTCPKDQQLILDKCEYDFTQFKHMLDSDDFHN